jgi:hypothetical protein
MLLSFFLKKIIRTTKLFLLTIPLIFISDNIILADCSCSVGSNGITNIGFALEARSCPNETDYYSYDVYFNAECSNNILNYLQFSTSYFKGTPESAIALFADGDDIVLRNQSGTHLIVVKVSTPSKTFNGKIAGVNISEKTPGVYYADPPEKLNQYCSPLTALPDNDSDGFPDCLDPCPEDAANWCEVCDQNREELIAQCHGEKNILYWDPVNCTGRCMQGANLGDCSDQ